MIPMPNDAMTVTQRREPQMDAEPGQDATRRLLFAHVGAFGTEEEFEKYLADMSLVIDLPDELTAEATAAYRLRSRLGRKISMHDIRVDRMPSEICLPTTVSESKSSEVDAGPTASDSSETAATQANPTHRNIDDNHMITRNASDAYPPSSGGTAVEAQAQEKKTQEELGTSLVTFDCEDGEMNDGEFCRFLVFCSGDRSNAGGTAVEAQAQDKKTQEELGTSLVTFDCEDGEMNDDEFCPVPDFCSGDRSNAADAELPTTSASARTAPLSDPNSDSVAQARIRNAAAPAEGTAAASQVDDAQDEPPPSEGGEERDENSARCDAPRRGRRKERPSRQSDGGSEVGAVQVDEQAPQLNRRFFLGLNRPSARCRARERVRDRARAFRRRRTTLTTDTEGESGGEQRRAAQTDEGEAPRPRNDRESEGSARSETLVGSTSAVLIASVRASGNSQQQMRSFNADDAEAQMSQAGDSNGSAFSGGVSTALAKPIRRLNTRGEYMINAVLVEEDESDVVVAEPVSYFARKWQSLAFLMCLLLVTMAVVLSVEMTRNGEPVPIAVQQDLQPSMQPSSPPSFDPSPTLQLVQARGRVRCGRGEWSKTDSGDDMYVDLCRSVAAVVLGDPDSIEEVIVTGSDRFEKLHGRDVDLLLYGDTHTIEREVREVTTGSGFTFSSPYYYDGLSYYGESMYVECAEQRRRYGDCSRLRICTYTGSTGLAFLRMYFPSDFIAEGLSLVEMIEMTRNGDCNVMAANKLSLLLNIASMDNHADGTYVLGDMMMTNEPYAAVTRNDDTEFSDIVNWVIQALFYGEEQGLTKSSSLCHPRTNSTGSVRDLDFLSAVYCVGNYGEILRGDDGNRGPNQINDGTTGMLYSIPFGELGREVDSGNMMSVYKTMLHEMRNNGTLNCGVIVPDGDNGAEDTAVDEKLLGMSEDYCHAVAAALFNGNHGSINLRKFSANDDGWFHALNDGTIDVLSGARIEQEYDFESSPSLGGFHFSTPYYYGKKTETGGDDAMYSLATRDANVLLSSFVNCVVLATIYAQENNIGKMNSIDMPLVSLFGNEFTWALRDTIDYSGGYDQVYEKHFGEGATEEERGRNYLNGHGSPQIHSFPGLGH